MTQPLDALSLPLHGARLIEASAGTGKTWTIAALYLRLVLGHGEGPGRPLLPAEILVMTFTRAATRELSDRIRARLVSAAAVFRGESKTDEPFLIDLLAAYPDATARQQAAYRLQLAAGAMDEAAIYTIDAWCQRTLREFAFESGSLFDETVAEDEPRLYRDAVRDYWRREVYPLDAGAFTAYQSQFANPDALARALGAYAQMPEHAVPPTEPLSALIDRHLAERAAALSPLKADWSARIPRLRAWLDRTCATQAGCFDGRVFKPEKVSGWFDALAAWAADPGAIQPDLNDTAWNRLTPEGIAAAIKPRCSVEIPADFAAVPVLRAALNGLTPLRPAMLAHALAGVATNFAALKAEARVFGFPDALHRLIRTLEGDVGAVLAARLRARYPCAMIDEFQDTSYAQYRLFNAIYGVDANVSHETATALLLIGDPKQSIYGFRGADIHSYLAARRATTGRHYRLDTNYRSSDALVQAVNALFLWAEGDGDVPGWPGGAFRYRRADEPTPLPFERVGAKGRPESWCAGRTVPTAALTVWTGELDGVTKARERLAAQAAETLATLLNDPEAGFWRGETFTRLRPGDVAILVRKGAEATVMRQALRLRGIVSVSLSDRDSVFATAEAADLLRWLRAIAEPDNVRLARAAFATATLALPLSKLAAQVQDEYAWERRLEQLRDAQADWQRLGVLAMLRRWLHTFDVPARLLHAPDGERQLTNLLHLAELLQAESQRLEGEHALLRWLAEQIQAATDNSRRQAAEAHELRLESDAERVQVVTIHKSKGLEYPLVFLPFVCLPPSAPKPSDGVFEYTDAEGVRHLAFSATPAVLAARRDAERDEDLRLLYVALTRARHALWLGAACVRPGRTSDNKLHETALGYLLGGGAQMAPASVATALATLATRAPGLQPVPLPDGIAVTRVLPGEPPPPLIAHAPYTGRFERDWQVTSFTALTRLLTTPTPQTAREMAALADEGEAPASPPVEPGAEAPWHRFPRGALPGNFVHGELEWLAETGFARAHDADFADRVKRRCEHAGWSRHAEDLAHWLRRIVSIPLPPIGQPLTALRTWQAEMEFWFPSEGVAVSEIDHLCQVALLDGRPRAPLPARALQGMLKGYVDLVFEHEGRYWVLDYKSNVLGAHDAAYTSGAIQQAMADHRYDVQGMVYLLALHRLLRHRLGPAYDPNRHLGGAIFFFLRGLDGPVAGCETLPVVPAMLDLLEASVETTA